MDDDKQLAGEILAVLRGQELAPVEPPTAPDLRGLTGPVAAQRRVEFEAKQTEYVTYLLSKPTSALTVAEQGSIAAALAEWARRPG